MSQFSNVMEVFNLLDKSNCRKCGEKTCMAFAAAVFMGKMQLDHCPLLSPEITKNVGSQDKKTHMPEEDYEKKVAALKEELRTMDLAARAESIGANYDRGRLTLKIMGKDFSLDANGRIYTDIHVNLWILVSVLNYVIHCQGIPLTANWVPLRELRGGQDWSRFFSHQCEKLLKKTADAYPDLFSDLVHMFSGKKVSDQFESDIAVVLSPLPLVPMLICYWLPEDGMESSLNLFFDATASDNLGVDGLYLLGTGIARMLEKLTQQHGMVGG